MEKIVVYVAGNPNAYPIEYFDADTERFQGVIPELLREFSEQSIYDVQYYAAGRTDQRRQLAENRQVDLISGLDDEQTMPHQAGEEILLLETNLDGVPVVYRLCLLDVAPETMAGELRSFLAEAAQRDMTGMVIEAARQPHFWQGMKTVVMGLSLTVAALIAVIVHQRRSHRRRIQQMERGRESDPVTGIGNMEYLFRHYRVFIHDKNRVLYSMFCFCLDPERSSGSEDAAVFLRHMAVILQDSISDTDILARVSDDGFAVLRLSAGEEESVNWTASVLTRIRSAVQADGNARIYKIAAGIYPLRAEDRELNEIIFRGLRTAQAALQKGEDYRFFRTENLQSGKEEQQLRKDIRSGLKNGELQIEIQFYIEPKTGRAVGGEIIPYWEHPEKGLIPAERFLPLVEQEKLTCQMEDCLLERVCTLLEELHKKGTGGFFLLFSLSEDAISDQDTVQRLAEIIGKYPFRREKLFFGIPQNCVNCGSEVAERLRAIRELGVQLVLNGFDGQLTVLSSLPDGEFSGLKLCRALTGNVDTPSGQAVLRAAIQTGHELKMACFAEEVTEEKQAKQLRKAGCDLMRGNLFFYPVPFWKARKQLLEQDVYRRAR